MNILRLLTLLTALWLLTGCGGGSSPPSAAPVPQTCGFGLVYADGGTSGYAISPKATSTPKSLSPCSITQVQSVTLGLCITPAQTSELKVQLLDTGSASLAINLGAAAYAGNCLISGSLYTVSLPSTALGSGLGNNWYLSVEDTVPGYTSSYLVGWSLEVKGLK
jgi:hypothetical protein